MDHQVGDFIHYTIVCDLKCNHLLRLDFQFSEKFDLIHVEGTAVQDPPIKTTIWFAKSLSDEIDDFIIRDNSVLGNVALEHSCIVIIAIPSHNFFDELRYLNVDQLILF